jgi:hypothetical protein
MTIRMRIPAPKISLLSLAEELGRRKVFLLIVEDDDENEGNKTERD